MSFKGIASESILTRRMTFSIYITGKAKRRRITRQDLRYYLGNNSARPWSTTWYGVPLANILYY